MLTKNKAGGFPQGSRDLRECSRRFPHAIKRACSGFPRRERGSRTPLNARVFAVPAARTWFPRAIKRACLLFPRQEQVSRESTQRSRNLNRSTKFQEVN